MQKRKIVLRGMSISCSNIQDVQELKKAFGPALQQEIRARENKQRGLREFTLSLIDLALDDAGYKQKSTQGLKTGIYFTGNKQAFEVLEEHFDQDIAEAQRIKGSSFTALDQAWQGFESQDLDLALVAAVFGPANKEIEQRSSGPEQALPGTLDNLCGGLLVLQAIAPAEKVNDPVLEGFWPAAEGGCSDQAGAGADADADFLNLKDKLSLIFVENDPASSLPNASLAQSFAPIARKDFFQRYLYNLSEFELHPDLLDMAGIMTARIALLNRLIPANKAQKYQVDEQNPAFLKTDQARPWFQGGQTRYAGIYTCSAQLILKEGDRQVPEDQLYAKDAENIIDCADLNRPTELFLISGASRQELLQKIKELSARIKAEADRSPGRDREVQGLQAFDLAKELAAAEQKEFRLAIIAEDLEDLQHKLEMAQKKILKTKKQHLRLVNRVFFGQLEQSEDRGKTVFLFPGQGSQYTGMFADLYIYFPQVRKWVEAFDAIGARINLPELPSILYPPNAGFSAQEDAYVQQAIHKVDIGGLGTILASQALYGLLSHLGIKAEAMLGHSNGENTALVASGTMSLDIEGVIQAILNIQKISQDAETDQSIKGRALAVSITDKERFKEVLQQYNSEIFWTMDNCPHQAVLFGKQKAIDQVAKNLHNAGGICTSLPFDIGFHTPLMQRYERRLRSFFGTQEFKTGHTALYSSIDCARYPQDADKMRDLAAKHWTCRVRFQETIEHLYAQGFRNFIEVGPNNLLTSFVADILRGKAHLALASNVKNLSGLEQIQRVLAECFIRGLPACPEKLYEQKKDDKPDIEPDGNKSRAQGQKQCIRGDESQECGFELRAQIARDHFELMNDFIKSQSRVFEALFTNRPGQAAQEKKAKQVTASAEQFAPSASGKQDAGTKDATNAAPKAYPFLRAIKSSPEQNSGYLHCSCELDINRDIFLMDHCLGRVVDDQPLSALPVLPFSFSMEILAEAASRLFSGRLKVIEIQKVRGHRWLTLNQGTLDLEVRGRVIEDRQGQKKAEVKLFLKDELAGERIDPVFEGVVKLKEKFPRGQGRLYPEDNGLTPKWSASEFYKRCMFHGPKLQGIKDLEYFTANSFYAQLKVLPGEGLFKDKQDPDFEVPACLLDCVSQLAGYWLVEQKSEEAGLSVPGSFGMFPFSFDSFEQFRDINSAGSRLFCYGQVDYSRERLKVRVEIKDKSKNLVARIQGGDYRYFHWPMNYFLYLNHPEIETYFSRLYRFEQEGLWVRKLESLSKEFLESARGVWKQALAHIVLSPKEREVWYAFPAKGPRRLDWLLGRLTAKETIRYWARTKYGIKILPRNIEILADKYGKPVVHCQKLKDLPQSVHISITHRKQCYLAGLIENQLIGIDWEPIGRAENKHWLKGAFSQEELEKFSNNYEQLLTLWCTKEAAAKALGTGFQKDPKNWRVSSVDSARGKAEVYFEDKEFKVEFSKGQEAIFAVCILPLNRA